MTPDRWRQISAIYDAAAALTDADRAAYLAQACGADEELRRSVESLLGQGKSFLATPVALPSGSRLGPYELLSVIGAGGMGVVYRAHDSKLHRDVALKVLPEAFASDPDRLARFRREATVLASLNHSNIGAIYGFEDSGDVHALVLELVEGPTLADRIAHGPIPLEEALPIARQIADALEAAHEQGIIHRDLKPANIKLRPDGTVKVLDFGLAKALDPPAPAGVHATVSPTISSPAMMTGVGMLLGTAAYMSAEQARGKRADKRSDIWAFGCVLYEMLTGRRAFPGDEVADVLVGVLSKEPDWSALPEQTPQSIRRLLRRSIKRDQRRRLADIADARLELDEGAATSESSADSDAKRVATRTTGRLPWALAGVLGVAAFAGAVVTLQHLREKPPDVRPLRFTIAQPEDAILTGRIGARLSTTPQFAISPDGRYVVLVAMSQSVPSLWLRSLDNLEVRRIFGTEQASYPFWSPDSRFIAFFAEDKLLKVPIDGGPPIVLCSAGGIGLGGTWNRDDVIVFAPGTQGNGRVMQSAATLVRVSAAGGSPTAVTTLDARRGDELHTWPSFLPDGHRFVYVARTVSGGAGVEVRKGELRLGSLDSGESRTIGMADSAPAYASGHLFFWRDGTEFAERFDPARPDLRSDPVFVADQISRDLFWAPAFSVSQNGIAAYAQSSLQLSQLVWKDRKGRELGTVGDTGYYSSVTLAPDDSRVAVSLATGRPPNRDIWIIDVARGTQSRLTFGPQMDTLPTWSPDGSRVAFYSERNRPGSGDLYVKSATGSGPEEPLLINDHSKPLTDWSSDGKFLVYTDVRNFDLLILPLSGDRKPFPFLQSPFAEDVAAFSPDSRWIAYRSDESGTGEIYVQPFPATGAKFQISRGGGTQPIWRRDGRELFFLAPDGTMMAASITPGTQFEAGTPQRLFASGVDSSVGTLRRMYTVTKDGERFLLNTPQRRPVSLTVVVNWPAALKE